MTTPITHCGNCHTCGRKLRTVLDGEEWCDHCGEYRRYRSHGWVAVVGENSPCPTTAATPAAEPEYTLLFDAAEGYHAEWVDDWSETSAE